MNSPEDVLNASQPKKMNAAYLPLLAVPMIFLLSVIHDKLVVFLVTACLFSAIAYIAHRRKLHVVVRLALLAGAIGAAASAWFYGLA